MTISKQSEQYSIQDTYNGTEVNGIATLGEYLSININFYVNDYYWNASYNDGNPVSINVNCPKESLSDFTKYFVDLVNKVDAEFNKESAA